jgi:Mn-dependent DtxR family transcriptional regulator
MLMEIKKLLIERGQMSVTDLSRHFYLSESIMLGMLSHWKKKGSVEVIDASGACGNSCGCSEGEDSKIFYRWKNVAEKPIFMNVKH